MTEGFKSLRLKANGELAQTGASMAGMVETLGYNPTGGNILLLDFFMFSWASAESTECMSIQGKLDWHAFYNKVHTY